MKVAILGFGVVGSGAYETIKDANCGLTVKYILDKRTFPGYEDLVTSDYDKILNDPEVEIVAEAIGGLHPAYEFVSAALRAGKHVISANKHFSLMPFSSHFIHSKLTCSPPNFSSKISFISF